MKIKFLLYGHKGWIGSKVLKELENQSIDVILGNSRVENIQDLEEEIIKIKPTHIISTIGRTHGTYNNKVYSTIDYLEQTGKLVDNVQDNLFGPVVLALLSKKYSFHLSYLGTGCIFEFDQEHPFGEEINGFNEKS